jgi:hypothetical protein
MTKRSTVVADDADDALAEALGSTLIPDPEIREDLNICAMTSDRWDEDQDMIDLGWPPPVRINRRKYRVAEAYRQFKKNLIDKAIRERAIITRAHRRETA